MDGVGGWVGDITCIFFVPMSTIDDSWLSFVPPPVTRGALRLRMTALRSATTVRGRSDLLRAQPRSVGDIRVYFL